MLLNSYKMESLGVEGVVWPIGLGSTGIGRCFGHRSIADTDPTGFLSDDSDLNMLIDDILESSDGSEDSIDLDYRARPLTAPEANVFDLRGHLDQRTYERKVDTSIS
jgi:hypothetical protein